MAKLRVILLLIILSTVISAPLLLNPSKIGIQDWDYALGHGLLQQISINNYGQIPLWNPYYCGGMTNIGNPQTDFLSPYFLPIVLFGPVLGYRIVFFLMCLSGLIGMYILGRYLKVSQLASIFMGILYFGSGIFSAPFAGGMPMYLATAFLPYMFYFYLRSKLGNFTNFLGISTALTLMYLWGFHYILVIILFLIIFGITWSIFSKNIKPLLISLFSIIFFFGFSAPRLIPLIANTRMSERNINEAASGYTLESLEYSLLSTNQSFETHDLITPAVATLISGRTASTAEEVMYVGVIGILLFVIGLITFGRKTLPLLITFLVLFWIMMGTQLPLSLYNFIRSLPFYEYMRVAQRYRYPAMIIFSIYAGFGLDTILKKFKKFNKNTKFITFVGIIFITIYIIDLSRVNYPLLKSAFILPTPKIESSKTFKHLCNNEQYYSQQGVENQASLNTSWHFVYPYILANYGVSYYCNEPLPIKNNVSCANNEPYDGEFMLSPNSGSAKLEFWSPNRLKYSLSLNHESSLTINQNYDSGWKVLIDGNKGRVIPSEIEKIKVILPKNSKNVELYYFPDTLIYGLFISLTSLFMALGMIWIPKFINASNFLRRK